MLLLASRGMCQTPPAEGDALRALLTEVHQLRGDIQAMTVASSRVQIALYGLQLQDAVVARGVVRLDAIRNRCSSAEAGFQHITADLQKLEQGIASAGNVPEADVR